MYISSLLNYYTVLDFKMVSGRIKSVYEYKSFRYKRDKYKVSKISVSYITFLTTYILHVNILNITFRMKKINKGFRCKLNMWNHISMDVISVKDVSEPSRSMMAKDT